MERHDPVDAGPARQGSRLRRGQVMLLRRDLAVLVEKDGFDEQRIRLAGKVDDPRRVLRVIGRIDDIGEDL